MPIRRREAVTCALAGWAPAQAAPPESIQVVYADYRPYSWQEGAAFRGLEVDIANELLGKRLGLKAVHRILPWARAQSEIEHGRADLIFATRTPTRDAIARALSPPVLNWQVAAIRRRKGRVEIPMQIEGLDQLCQWRLGALLGNQWVSQNLPCTTKTSVGSTQTLLRMLLVDRFDLVVDDRLVMQDVAKQLGVEGQVEFHPITGSAAPIHLQVGRRSPFIQQADRIESALQAMAADGSLARLGTL